MTFYSQEIRNIGKLITMGSLNLTLTLKLEKSEIQNLNINLRNLKTLNDLSFIIDNEFLWDKIELSSKSELLNTLFHMNKIKRMKNIVAYLVYDKLQFNKEQIKFQRLLDCVLLSNGVVIYSYDICKCNINICFRIVYKTFVKRIMLYGEEELDDDDLNMDYQNDFDYNDSILNNINNSTSKNNISSIEEKKNNNYNSIIKIKSEIKEKEKEGDITSNEEEEEESDNEDYDNIGLFEKIPENEVNFSEFKYIYIHFRDYLLYGEFNELFKLEELYNFLRKIKKNSNIKIIFNFTEGLKYTKKYLLKFMKISDIHIFRKKTELLEILIKKNETDKKIMKRKNKKIMDILKLRNTDLAKRLKNLNNRNETNNSAKSLIKLNKLNKSSGEKPDNNYYLKKLENNKSQSLKNLLLTKSLNITFDRQKIGVIDKNNIHQYIHKFLFLPNSNILETYYNDKLGIYLDDFKKIYITDYKKNKLKPDITEYDFNIYPKSNVHNLRTIENIKEILYSKYSMFSYIIYGCILSTILDDIVNGKESYYLFYFYIRVSLLKILSLIKSGMPIPSDKGFYILELKKNELNKIISEENTKKKENGFNMNYLHRNYKNKDRPNKNENSLIRLFDKFGTLSIGNMDSTIHKEMLLENNKYFDSKFGTVNIDINTMTNQRFRRFSKERNFNRELWTKKYEKKNSFKNIKGIPEYAVYLSKKDRKRLIKINKLPPIKIQKKAKFIENFLGSKVEQLHKNKYTEDYKIDISKYKEIVFQSTQQDQ